MWITHCYKLKILNTSSEMHTEQAWQPNRTTEMGLQEIQNGDRYLATKKRTDPMGEKSPTSSFQT